MELIQRIWATLSYCGNVPGTPESTTANAAKQCLDKRKKSTRQHLSPLELRLGELNYIHRVLLLDLDKWVQGKTSPKPV